MRMIMKRAKEESQKEVDGICGSIWTTTRPTTN